jgi:hypothetical protein
MRRTLQHIDLSVALTHSAMSLPARLQRERELINRALSSTTLKRNEPVPELKAVAPPSVSAEDLEMAKLTGTEIAARKAEEAKAAARAEKEAKKASSSRCLLGPGVSLLGLVGLGSLSGARARVPLSLLLLIGCWHLTILDRALLHTKATRRA